MREERKVLAGTISREYGEAWYEVHQEGRGDLGWRCVSNSWDQAKASALRRTKETGERHVVTVASEKPLSQRCVLYRTRRPRQPAMPPPIKDL